MAVVTLRELLVEAGGVIILNWFIGLAVYNAHTEGGQSAFSICTAAGLLIASMVRFGGEISGTHINPVVSVVMWLDGKIKTVKMVIYIIA